MEDIKGLSKFKHFMKKKNAYEPFMLYFNNRKATYHAYMNMSFKKYIKTTPIAKLIIHAFRWDKTNEGPMYWHQVQQSWIAYCKEEFKCEVIYLLRSYLTY